MSKKKKETTLFNNRYCEWEKYSDTCPWRNREVCVATARVCNYTNCALLHFLDIYQNKENHV